MPTERPTIASCPHCRAILLRTERALIHPTGGEREEIQRALGEYWSEHPTTRFDGRFHRCLGRERLEYASLPRRLHEDGRNEPDSGHSPYRGPHRDLTVSSHLRRPLLLGMLCAALPSFAIAQEPLGPAPQALPPGFAAEVARQSEGLRAGPTSGRGIAVAPNPATDGARLLDRFLSPRSESGRRVDDQVVRAERVTASEDALSCDLSPAGRSIRTGSWQGLELASGRYQIVDTLREAPMGVVYLAHDRNLDSDVVVEVPTLPRLHNPESTARFMRAVRSLACLVHPNLVKVTEVGTLDDAPFVVAERRAGGSLRFRRPVGPNGRPAPVTPDSLEQWLPDVSDALDFLHTRNRIYREISPANILFDENGRAALGGAGMAEAVAEWLRIPSEGTPSDNPLLVGPSPVIAPEVVEGRPADGRADQYALAATVYELLSGHAPFEGQTPAGRSLNDSIAEPVELRRLCPSISEALSSAVQRGLAPDPRRRFPDCTSFARAVVSASRATAPSLVPLPKPAPVVEPTRGLDAQRALAALPGPRHRDPAQAAQVAMGMACCVLLGVVGASAMRFRTRVAPREQTAHSRPPAAPSALEVLGLPGSADLDGSPRALPDATRRADSNPRGLDVRRHSSELAGRSHLTQVPALLSSGSVGRELQLSVLDPRNDRPKTRSADDLLPVLATRTSTDAEPKPGLPALARRRLS